MENQHRKISGYRELTQAEIDLMNEVKAMGPQLKALCDKVNAHIKSQRDAVNAETDEDDAALEAIRLNDAEPEKWARWAFDGFQSNLMCLTRAVAQPTFF